MKERLFIRSSIVAAAITICLIASGCDVKFSTGDPTPVQGSDSKVSDANANSNLEPNGTAAAVEGSAAVKTDGPTNVKQFFMELPEEYFTLEGCDRSSDKGCKRAKESYLKDMGDVVDIANGYIKGGCDGAQACIEMAIFKRPDGSYLVGVATFAEMMNDFRFLDLKNGKWTDVSSSVVPEYSDRMWYEIPRYGTTMKVFEKTVTEQTSEFQISERGSALYSLEWRDGKFSKKK